MTLVLQLSMLGKGWAEPTVPAGTFFSAQFFDTLLHEHRTDKDCQDQAVDTAERSLLMPGMRVMNSLSMLSSTSVSASSRRLMPSHCCLLLYIAVNVVVHDTEHVHYLHTVPDGSLAVSCKLLTTLNESMKLEVLVMSE